MHFITNCHATLVFYNDIHNVWAYMSTLHSAVIVIVRKLWFPLTIHGIYMGILVLYFPEEL